MSESNESQHVCVIGIGNMGSALAEALLAKGHNVTVWNRTASKCDPLAEAGASVAASVSEAAAAAKTVVVCVSDHAATVSIVDNDEMAEVLKGKTLVQLTIVTADESRDLGRWAEENGIAYLDGSILSYPQGIRDNSATIVYSGPKDVFAANESVLAAMGGNPILVGEAVGGAPTFDKTIHACHYGSMLAFFHGAAICHAAGFPIETYIDRVVNVEANRRRFGEMIAKRSYDSKGGSIEGAVAAYEHVTELSEEHGIDAAFPRTVAGYMDRAIAEGRGQQELAAVFELMIEKGA